MERLTKRNEQNTGYYYPHCFKKCDGLGAGSECDECDFMDKISEKLGRLEDLEEQGRLLKLPCAVGEWVYVIKENGNIDTHKIVTVEIDEDGVHFNSSYRFGELEDFGRTIFLTKEEAEAALEERGSRE